MKHLRPLPVICVALCAMISPAARADDTTAKPALASAEEADAFLKLYERSKHLWVGKVDGGIADFVADDDTDSLQFVILADDRLDASQVSTDGQVIFLRESDDPKKVVQPLMVESSRRRLKVLQPNGP